MAGDFNKPVAGDTYVNVLQSIRDLFADNIKMLDGTGTTNVPNGAIRWSATNKRWEKYNGSAWGELIAKASDKYDINVDRVDGYDAGNASGNIPVSNGTVNTNLNADLLDGNHASSFVLAPPQGQGGVRRLYRNDDPSNYNVQTNWTGTRWRLKGYLNDTFHAEAEVAYADSAGSAGNATTFNSRTSAERTWFQTLRDFTTGTLIQTTIDYSVSNGEPFLLEIEGNSYDSVIPFDIKVQGYIYANTVINFGGFSNGTGIAGLVLFNYSGKLCFWFPRQSYWQGFNVWVNSSYQGEKINRVTSITDSAKPAGISKEVSLSSSIYQSITTQTFDPNAKANLSGAAFTGAISFPNISSMNGTAPANGVMRMTPNLHLNSGAGYSVILNWDQGTTGTSQALRVGNGAGSDSFYVRADGYVWAAQYGFLHDRFAHISHTHSGLITSVSFTGTGNGSALAASISGTTMSISHNCNCNCCGG